jgi:predicted deacylase
VPNETFPTLDRRSFLVAPLAAAAVVANAGQAAAATTGNTVFTGDVVNGKKVVSTLDIADLEAGRKHLLYFQGVESATGQPWLVSVMVAKGRQPGKRITLTSGVHGDEMSSIRVVQMVMQQLDPAQMAGSVMAVLDISRPALETMQRRWPNQGRGIDLIDINREWPGNENGASAPSRHAGLLFNRLLKPNSDIALDFHTGTTGLECADFIIGDRGIPEVKTLIDLYPIRQVWDSKAYAGVLHNAFTAAGIPSMCPEVGAARVLDPKLIAPFVEGTMNVLKHYGVIGGTIGRTGADSGVYIANSAAPILATEGGFIEHLVKLNDKVQSGQKVIVQRNAFGETVAEYASPVDGEVGAIRSDTSSEPGNVLMFILFSRAPAAGDAGYPE